MIVLCEDDATRSGCGQAGGAARRGRGAHAGAARLHRGGADGRVEGDGRRRAARSLGPHVVGRARDRRRAERRADAARGGHERRDGDAKQGCATPRSLAARRTPTTAGSRRCSGTCRRILIEVQPAHCRFVVAPLSLQRRARRTLRRVVRAQKAGASALVDVGGVVVEEGDAGGALQVGDRVALAQQLGIIGFPFSMTCHPRSDPSDAGVTMSASEKAPGR